MSHHRSPMQDRLPNQQRNNSAQCPRSSTRFRKNPAECQPAQMPFPPKPCVRRKGAEPAQAEAAHAPRPLHCQHRQTGRQELRVRFSSLRIWLKRAALARLQWGRPAERDGCDQRSPSNQVIESTSMGRKSHGLPKSLQMQPTFHSLSQETREPARHRTGYHYPAFRPKGETLGQSPQPTWPDQESPENPQSHSPPPVPPPCEPVHHQSKPPPHDGEPKRSPHAHLPPSARSLAQPRIPRHQQPETAPHESPLEPPPPRANHSHQSQSHEIPPAQSRSPGKRPKADRSDLSRKKPQARRYR